ncbi:hypothetical protein Dimus_028487 [Dionaea muscipula]
MVMIEITRKGIVEMRESLTIQFSNAPKAVLDGLTAQLRSLLRAEDLMYQQWMKADWIKLVDRNTKFFNTQSRRHSNQITGIRCVDGSRVSSKEGIAAKIVRFYHELLGTSQSRSCLLN